MNADVTPAWRRSLDEVLATDWTPEDLEEWLRNLANDSEVSDSEYRDASAEVHSVIDGDHDDPGSALEDPDFWDDGHHELDGVDAAVYSLLDGGEPINEQTLASVGVSYEQYWALVADREAIQDRLWQRGSDAASWSADSGPDAYDPVLDALIVEDPAERAQATGRSWSDPVDPAHGLLDEEQAVTDARDRVYSALTGLDPTEHDTRELTDLVRSDWLEDWTPEEMREHYRRTDYPVNLLGTQHLPAARTDTQDLVDQAVADVEELATGPTTACSDDDEQMRAEQLNHWAVEDLDDDSDSATDEEASDDLG